MKYENMPKGRNKDICVRCGKRANFADRLKEEFKNFDREDLILLIECQKERIGELLADKDTPQTMYYPQVDGITPSVLVADTPQTDVYDYKGNGKWERSE